MKLNTNSNKKINSQRKKKNVRNNVSLVKVAGLTVLLLMLILSAAFFLNSKLPAATVSEKESKDIFYSINSDNLKRFEPFADGVALLSASSLKYLDSSGNEIVTNAHSFANPVIDVNSKQYSYMTEADILFVLKTTQVNTKAFLLIQL